MSVICETGNPISLDDLRQVLPERPLYGEPEANTPALSTGWLLSPTPYCLSPAQASELKQLGTTLHRFTKALDELYRSALKDPQIHWVRQLLDAGKPQHLLNFGQMNRFKHHLPRVIRPDLLITDKGFRLTEIDAVPGGIGFTAALSQAYQQLGFELLGAPEGMLQAFLAMLRDASAKDLPNPPIIGIIVSDEAGDYRAEWKWLINTLQAEYPDIYLLHPRDITLERNRLGFIRENGQFQGIDTLYRFFELFDLPNIPQIELIQYAVKKGLVQCTPPFKPHLEEKLMLALVHNPGLAPFWERPLGPEGFSQLQQLVPESWVVDPTPVPPQAQIVPPLTFQSQTFRDFTSLGNLTQKQRELILKPSGFSPLAWGSRGVVVGHDIPQEAWQNALSEALAQFETTPHLLQRFENTRVEPYSYFHPETGAVETHEGRTRLCPYYFVINDEPQLAGVLATTCPKNKKIIHGMRDGVMRPATIGQNT